MNQAASMKASWITPVWCFFWAALVSVTINVGNTAEPTGDEESKTEELAKKTQNPIANLISVPFQNNFNFGIGPNDATQWVRVLRIPSATGTLLLAAPQSLASSRC